MASTGVQSKSEEFESCWKDKFPGVAVPKLSCFENVDNTGSTDNQKQQFRKLLQGALDYHSFRIEELQKKLGQQQFLVEYIAKELEQLPVPREAGSASPASNAESRPTPLPRKAPAVPKKPKKSSSSDDAALSGMLRRNHSAPAPRSGSSSDKKGFSSVFLPDESIEETLVIGEQPGEAKTNSTALSNDSGSTDNRFQTFQGTTFSGSRRPSGSPRPSDSSSTPSTAISNPAAGSPAIIENKITADYEVPVIRPPSSSKASRNSMKRMSRINIEDTESSSDGSSPDASSDYMHLWTVKPPLSTERTSSSVSSEGFGQVSEENVEDSSAASIQSSSGRPAKKGSRMVRVDYSDKNGGPQAIRDENDENINHDDVCDTDEEDDKPHYVQLVYNALSQVQFIKPSDTDSVASSASNEPATPSADALAESKGKEVGDTAENTPAISDNQPSYQMQESVTEETDGEAENGNLQMRNWVVNSVLESEKSYIDDLNVLIQYKKSLESAAQSSVPMINVSECAAIFSNLHEIHEVHSDFRKRLEPIVAEWSERSEVGELFKEMAVNLQHYNTYLENYPNAIATLKRCCQENTRFEQLVNLIKCPSTQEMHHLMEILHKPINRMQRNSLVLQDLIKCTPISHPDHKMLLSALKLSQHFLRDQMTLCSVGNDKTSLHVLVKNQLVVEYVAGKARKLRHVFVFHDLIVCTKCMIVKGKHHYEVKWHVLLSDLQLSDKMDDTPVEWKQRVPKAEKEIQAMKGKLKESKAQLRREFRESKDKNIDTSSNVKIQRLTKKIQEQEANLILAEPRLRFTISTKKGAQFCFLMSSDYERRELQSTIQTLKAKVPVDSKVKISLIEAQSIVDLCKDNVHLNNVDQRVMKEAADEDIVNGQLTITIHKILGLQESCETFTAIEVDSFGHFNLKAKTSVLKSDKPVWNESFAIDLESSSTLRLICYSRSADGDVLLGKCPLNLHKLWLKQGFQEKELSMNEVTLTLSIKYQTAEQTIRRMPSKIEVGIFGVRLSSTCGKEGLKIPAFVTACIEDVEKRGIDEMGIYRVSGTTSDVQRIRKAFDKGSRIGKTLLPDVEINAVTGALKLYLRELPEAVITDALYPILIETYKIQDKDEQEKKMITLLGSLPDPNYYTMMAILEHLIRVGKQESSNKMPFHNLAVVFGPTLLKPAVKKQATDTMDLFSSSANDAMYQSGIIYYYLTLLSKGVQFR